MSVPTSLASEPPSTDFNDNPSLLLLLTITFIGMFAFLQVYSVQSILPDLQRDLHASVVQLGSAVGATVLAVALVSALMGIFSDMAGRKWLIVASVFALAIPTILMAWADTVNELTILRFLQGLAVPGVTVVTVAYIGEEFRLSIMTRIMAMYVTGTIVGGFLGRFMLGYLTEFMTWRHAFAFMGAFNLAGALLVWWVLPASRHFVANPRFSSSLMQLRQLARNRFLLAPCALGFTVLFGQIGLFTYINFHLAAPPYLFSASQLGNVFMVYLLGMLVTPLSGHLLPRLGARRTMLASVGLSALGVVLTLLPSTLAIVAGLGLASCGVFVTNAANNSFIVHRITSSRSMAMGLYYTAYYTGGFVGAWACGVAYHLALWPGVVATLVFLQILGWLMAWRFMAPLAQAFKD